MLFNSLHFLIFLPIVLILYFKTAHKYRWIVLLTASLYFYMTWNAKYIVLILFSSIIDYFVAHQLDKTNEIRTRKFLLAISIISNLGLLFTFKYFNFFADSFSKIFSLPPTIINVILPVGISFYTFQALSYTIDVYKKEIKAEKHFGIFLIFITYFPQLVAGPIERAKNLLPQFFEKHSFSYDKFTNGLMLVLWGFFKKIVIADRVAVLVNAVYNSPTDYTGIPLILATILFAFQIYCDFSGYSDIAIGVARMMGFRLMTNFKRPFLATSIADFWKRWHISLSTWFRDYLYFPLGGNRVKVYRWYANLFLVFVVSGLWHGANWTFVFWGVLHGLYAVPYAILKTRTRYQKTEETKSGLKDIHQILFTFLLVLVGWVFFRAENITQAFYVFKKIFLDLPNLPSLSELYPKRLLLIGAFILVEWFQRNKEHALRLDNFPKWGRLSIYYFIIILILSLGNFNYIPFIYFQF